MRLAEKETKPSAFAYDLFRWFGILLIAMGGMILFSSYIYIPLDVWVWPWQYHWGLSYAGGWVGAPIAVVGVVVYAIAKWVRPREVR